MTDVFGYEDVSWHWAWRVCSGYFGNDNSIKSNHKWKLPNWTNKKFRLMRIIAWHGHQKSVPNRKRRNFCIFRYFQFIRLTIVSPTHIYYIQTSFSFAFCQRNWHLLYCMDDTKIHTRSISNRTQSKLRFQFELEVQHIASTTRIFSISCLYRNSFLVADEHISLLLATITTTVQKWQSR